MVHKQVRLELKRIKKTAREVSSMYTQTVASLTFEVGIKEVEVHAWLAVQNASNNHSSDNEYWRKVFFFFIKIE